MNHSLASLLACAMLPLLALGCSDNEAGPPAPCEQRCKDAAAARAVRESVKFAFNATVQGNPVGAQDETTGCPFGGQVHVTGDATANTEVGASEVSLTYILEGCRYLVYDNKSPGNSFDLTFSGALLQQGTIAVQPTATMALVMTSDSMTLSGTVYDPRLDYKAEGCVIDLQQQKNDLFGTICGRDVDTHL